VHALLLAATPQLQRSDFEQVVRQLEAELLRRLKIVLFHAVAAEDRASSHGVQDK
jgi:hypothetical protein